MVATRGRNFRELSDPLGEFSGSTAGYRENERKKGRWVKSIIKEKMVATRGRNFRELSDPLGEFSGSTAG